MPFQQFDSRENLSRNQIKINIIENNCILNESHTVGSGYQSWFVAPSTQSYWLTTASFAVEASLTVRHFPLEEEIN